MGDAADAGKAGAKAHMMMRSQGMQMDVRHDSLAALFDKYLRACGTGCAHGLSFALPTGQKVPSLHVRQSAALFMTVLEAFLVVPPGHGSGAAEPSVQ